MSSDSVQLISTLITAPPADARLIERSRLSRKLDDAVRHRVIHIRAPAGFGKTTLVATWIHRRREQGARVAWLSLNDSHDDVRVLLRYLVAALRTAWGAVGEATLTLLNSNLPVADAALVTTLVNELGGLSEDTFVVLDDFHCVTSAATNQAFHEFVCLAPARLHFVLTSREAPGFPIGRLRQLGQFYQVEARDLEFSPTEITEFLARENLDLSAADSAALARNTGGWAAGLRLAAICMREEPARSGFIDSFSGGHTAIAEFLQEDVLNRQPDGLQIFLLASGLLDDLSAPLCDFVLERNDSKAMLEATHHKGLFLFAVDTQGERYRYHRLFADFLRHRLQRIDPERARFINYRASQWYARNGSAYDAVEYALRAGDDDGAGQLLERFSEDIFTSGQIDLLRNLARRLPARVLRACPRLQLDLIWIHTLNWEIRQAERLMANVKAYVRDAASDGEVPDTLREKIFHREIMIAVMQDRLAEAEALWEQWPLVAAGHDAYFDGSAETARLIAGRERYASRFVIAQAPRVRRKFTDAGAEYGTVWFDSIVGPAYLMCGDTEKAESVLRGAIEVAIRLSGAESPVVAMPSLLLAEVLYERNELEAVQAIVDHWLPHADRIGFVDQLIAGFLCAARLAFIARDRDRAFTLLSRGDELAAEYRFERLEAHLVGERVRQLLALGRADDALAHTEASQVYRRTAIGPPGKLASITDEIVVTSGARLSRGTADAAPFIRIIKAWINYAEGHACTRASIRLRGVLAGMLHAAGDVREAWRALRPALHSAAASGIVRPLLDEGRSTLSILEAAMATDASTEDAIRWICEELHRALTEELDGAAGRIRSRRSPAVAAAVTDPLTPREREILGQIADGSSNKEIAARLGLSEATVKWHLQHTFEKLGVHRRIGALRKARELGLIR